MAHAVIFDMDGLLIDSEPLWVRAEMEIFREVGGVVLSEADCAQTKGLRVDDVVAYWHARRGFSVSGAEVEARLIERVIHLISTEGRALPGIDVAMASAKIFAPNTIALASSSPMPIIEAALARLGLVDAFDCVQSAQTEPAGKPHPGIFLRTAERLGVSPLDCVVIEDSMNGIIAAKAARMMCIGIPSDVDKGPRDPVQDARFVLADQLLVSLTEITPQLLDKLAKR